MDSQGGGYVCFCPVTVRGDANLLNAAADAMDSPALLLVDPAKLITVTIQTTLKRLILKRRRRMTFKTERALNLFYGENVFLYGDSEQLNDMNLIS